MNAPDQSRDRVASNLRIIGRVLLAVLAAAILTRVAFQLWGGDWPERALATAPREDVSQIKRVLIISIDGLRPDLLLRARTPRIKSLMDRGSYSMWARTTEVSITLPSHTSMLTGVRPEYHRIYWNHLIEHVYPDVPTIFEQAHKVKSGNDRLSTGMVAGKSKFHELARPGSVDYEEVYQDKEGSNLEVGESAAHMIAHHAPRVMFVHLPDVDVQGHGVGWSTPEQMRAIETADRAVGMILDALSEKGILRETLIILSADHGGQGGSHGANDPRSRHIPWIAAGPGIRKNQDLTRYKDLVINTEDTFATACTLMKIPLPQYLDGKFVDKIVDREELLDDVSLAAENKKKAAAAGNKPPDFDPWWEPPPYKWERAVVPEHHN